MDTTTKNVANGTAVTFLETLSNEEIELVAGGKADQPVKPWYERLMDWFSGGSPPAPPAGGIEITSADLVTMQRECRASGGDFYVTGATANGSGSYTLMNADGDVTYVSIRCVD